eukprot:5926916-Pleurochrysis_carterae.AAC.1
MRLLLRRRRQVGGAVANPERETSNILEPRPQSHGSERATSHWRVVADRDRETRNTPEQSVPGDHWEGRAVTSDKLELRMHQSLRGGR